LFQSRFVFCGPDSSGWSLIPVLAVQDEKIPNPQVFIFQDSGRKLETIENGEVLKFLHVLDNTLEYVKLLYIPHSELLSRFEGSNDVSKLLSFLHARPFSKPGECLHLRGKIGEWIEGSLEVADSAQYSSKLRHYSGQSDLLFKRAAKHGETGGIMYRPSTTYEWVDAFSSDVSHSQLSNDQESFCSFHQVTLDSFCSVLQAMDIRKILLLGDSLVLQQAQSLWKLLNQEDQPTTLHTLEPNFLHIITCPNHEESDGRLFHFKYQFIRNDLLVESTDPVSIDKDISNCGKSYCYPWFDDFQVDNNIRKLIIVSIGPHAINVGQFQEHFLEFIEHIDRFQQETSSQDKRVDIVMFRTLVPGHYGCSVPGLKPFHDYEEYKKFVQYDKDSLEDKWNWNILLDLNDIVAKSIYKRKNLDLLSSQKDFSKKTLIEVLDIMPMTILRRDGHISDEFRPATVPDGDCLHYALPGPIDWWNHLLFSNLKDIMLNEIKAPF